eukprot:217246_1
MTARGEAPCSCSSDSYCGSINSGYHPGATNMNELFWDPALASVAQVYADQCYFIHNDQRSKEAYDKKSIALWAQTKEKYAGENLYISSISSQDWNYFYGTKDYGVEGGMYGWWYECIDYNLESGSSCGSQVGHYTQYIRADSRFVGCGVANCPSGITTDTSTGSKYDWANLNVVCNYMGGQYGDTPYGIATSSSEVASDCEPDRVANFNWDGLCGGPQAADYFENPLTSYPSSYSNWICDDGVGRSQCSDNITPLPSSYPTERPTNKPITPGPTEPPTNTRTPTESPVDKADPNPVTPSPTDIIPTQRPTWRPTPTPTQKPTMRPTEAPIESPETTTTSSPDSGDCDLSDCDFDTVVNWESDTWQYSGFADAVWTTKKDLLSLSQESGWNAGWSWGGYYAKVDGEWVLFIEDDVAVSWTDMDCDKKEIVQAYLESDEYAAAMALGVEEIMGSSTGTVTSTVVEVSCSTSSASAFGAVDDSGDIILPFSTWNLNTYDFSDWFV